jgi:hypothetical protein
MVRLLVRLSDGMGFLYRAASPAENGTGAVAVIIAPGAPIRSNNNLQQNRTAANYLTASALSGLLGYSWMQRRRQCQFC